MITSFVAIELVLELSDAPSYISTRKKINRATLMPLAIFLPLKCPARL